MKAKTRLPGARAGLLLLVLLAGGWGRCEGEGATPLGPWELAFEDDFTGPAGTLPAPGTWTAEVGTGPNSDGWGNAELQYYTGRPENASLDGAGNLAIVARAEAFGGLRLPSGQGLWPAFWLLGADIGQVGWPACGEIDVMEYRGQEPRVALGTIHGPGYSGGASIGRTYQLPAGLPAFDEAFHVFTAEWDPRRIAFSVDGAVYHVVTPDSLPDGAAWVFEKPFFVILNVAVGGNFVGPVGAGTTFPQTMLVDWVRVWERGE
jgi:hypothetical protein